MRVEIGVETEHLEVVLDLSRVESLALGVDAGVCEHIGPLVHVGEQKGGADAGLGVEARAPVAMSASSDLEVEGAVNPVLLCAEDRCQVLGHSCE